MINRLHQRAYAFSLYRILVSSSVVQFFHTSNLETYWQETILWLDYRLEGPEKARQKILARFHRTLQNSFLAQNPTINRLIQHLPTLFQLPIDQEHIDPAATDDIVANWKMSLGATKPSLNETETIDSTRDSNRVDFKTVNPNIETILTHPTYVSPNNVHSSNVYSSQVQQDRAQKGTIQVYLQNTTFSFRKLFENLKLEPASGLRVGIVVAALLGLLWGLQSFLVPFVNSVRGSDVANGNPILAVINPNNMAVSAEALQMTAFQGTIGKGPEDSQELQDIEVISLFEESESDSGPMVADALTEVENMPESGILVSPFNDDGPSPLDKLRDSSGAIRMARLITPIPAPGSNSSNGSSNGVRAAVPRPPTATPTPVAIKSPVSTKRLWSIFAPPTENNDHFWVERPFSAGYSGQLASPSYQFGSTAGGRYRLHHGIDIANPNGTPLRAGTVGEVVHAGSDQEILLGPYNNFYGNTVVIKLDKKLEVAGGAIDVYMLYGHLSAVTAQAGQRVQVDDVVGLVGMTGIAIGPHLHAEVRLNENSYENSINPYLWIKPLANSGAVAIRILTADGRAWAGASFGLARTDGSWGRQIVTYSNQEHLIPDPAWGENGAMGSVPPGHYYLAGNINGEKLRTEFVVRANETTFVELRTQQ